MMNFFEPEAPITVLGTTYNKGEILMFRDVPLVTVEANKNRDIISEANAQEIAASVGLRPISVEHKNGSMAGIFTEAHYEAPHVVTSGLIYRKHVPTKVLEDMVAGNMSLSIEAAAEKASCTYCGETFLDQGDYCNHLKAKTVYNSYRKFEGMRGTGGAIVRDPAGSKTAIAAGAVSIIASHDAEELEGREFSTEERSKLSKSGAAMKDGSFPVVNAEDLHNAIKAAGRASDYDKAKAHIISRAKALGLTKELPDDWAKGARMADKECGHEPVIAKLQAELVEATAKLEVATKEKDDAIMKAKTYEDSPADKKQDKDNPGEDSPKDKKEDAAGQKKMDEMEKKHGDMKAALELQIKELTEKGQKLESQLQASVELRRHDVLVGSGVLTEDEWSGKKESLMKADDATIELLASKVPSGKKTILMQGGVQNVVRDTQKTVKPKLVFG